MNKFIKILPGYLLAFAMNSGYALDHVIELTAQGEVNVAPDTAIINLTVETMADTAQAAVAKNAEESAKVVNYLKDVLKEKNAVTTGQYNLSPVSEYDQTAKKSKLTGYQASNQIQVKTKDLKNLGGLLDQTVKLGITRIDSLTFQNSNEKKLSEDALKQAIFNGRQRAKLIADSAGVTLGNVVNIQPMEQFGPQPIFKSAALTARMDAGPTTPIESGELTLTSQVKMVFAIED